jgi:hypothetical protein
VEIRVTNSFMLISKIYLSLQLFSLNYIFSKVYEEFYVEINENPTNGLVSDNEATDEQKVGRSRLGSFFKYEVLSLFRKECIKCVSILISVFIRAQYGGASGLLRIVKQEVTHFAH